ncbi:vacuolar membrane protein [Kwoniella mangroviensis CBS 10435]|uniref:Vacuolar membrane protein n=1 Tax=Kwoniella mangroviensis CBS 10435 TaxID=1331196 RepID=A0A1B9IUC1_9TREE|nr:vacuolar membrane protein [Kwoniella mangroviensis CBS 10435]
MLSPAQVPLPSSPSSTTASRRSSSSAPFHPSPLSSPYTAFRPRLHRNPTSLTIRQEVIDPFKEGSIISVNQPVGSISISPNSRDVCLASRKGLYILDLVNLNNAPRFIPQGGTWQIADVQWSPHPATSNLILSTSSQKLLVWDLGAQKSLKKSIDAHARAITDINWHALNPNLMATVSMDAGIRGWDLRCWDRPFMRLCAWGAAGTQVKWNRRNEFILATAHNNLVQIWDNRKGSVPLTTINAHGSKIYGIDWDRRDREKLVTCSLDKTIKFWTVPELRSSSTSIIDSDPFTNVNPPDKPTSIITTSYPVWRARNLPFGRGVLSLPQRGEQALELFAPDDDTPVERFEGHENVVKDFVWRVRGGDDASFDDRDFQLITWGKDRTLRIWPVERGTMEKVGYRYGSTIDMLFSRRGAADVTYTVDPSASEDVEDNVKLPPPVVNPSNITRQKLTQNQNKANEAGMTRGGNKVRGMDQLEWLTKVVKTAPSPEASTVPSRIGSVSRNPSRSRGQSVEGTRTEWITLKDELVLLNKLFPRPKINFEKIDLAQRRLTMSMQGPWANGDRMAFIRIHWSFPPNYPFGPEIPTFELERNPTVSPITRQIIVTTIQERRAHNRQCLISTTGFLLGSHERIGRRLIDEESDSESEKGVENQRLGNVPMLIRTCGATFGPHGQLVCFFPKQVILPRTRITSRSPSITRDINPSPMIKAITALARLQNPHKRNAVRYKPRLKKFENVPPTQVQAGSTMTIHDVSYYSQLHAGLAKVYSTTSLENNLRHALDGKKLDHAEVWSTLRGVLSDPAPPAYSALPPPMAKVNDVRRERYDWERSMVRKKKVVDQMFAVLLAERNFQLLALVSCILLNHERTTYIPPPAETVISRSPEQDYFTLPRFTHSQITPTRQRTAGGGGSLPHSPTTNSSFRNSGWSQMLNPSAISLRGALTPKDRNSFSDLPFSKNQSQIQTPGSYSYEDVSSPTGGVFIPTPASGSGIVAVGGTKKLDSPRLKDKDKDNASGIVRPKMAQSISASASPPVITPLKSSGTERSYTSETNTNKHKVSFGSASPLGKGLMTRAGTAPPPSTGHHSSGYNTPAGYDVQTPNGSMGGAPGRRMIRGCAIRLDFPRDDSPPLSLLSEDIRPQCELWKLSYADFLLRMNLLEVRTELMNYQFTKTTDLWSVSKAASGVKVGLLYRLSCYQTDWLTPTMTLLIVCISCSGHIEGNCPSCNKQPKKALCSYCRLPIKGLSMGCFICAHKLHSKCFKLYFLSPITTPMTCPSCSCSCLAHRGISTPYYSISINTKPSPSITRGFARGNIITPVSPPSLNTSEGGRGRVTYASLAKLGSIREGLGITNTHTNTNTNSNANSSMDRSTSNTGIGLGGALGLSPEGDDTAGQGQGKDGQKNEGLLARARWGDGGLLHWKGHG